MSHVSSPNRQVRLAVAIALLASSTAPLVQAAEEEEILDQVVVTGTRVTTRSRLDTLSPVDVLSATSLQAQGSTELAEALGRLAPSLDFPRPALTDGTDTVRPVTLRGLSPDQTLVLVNSKRAHTSALVNVNGTVGRGSSATDLNTLPLAAIDRIEVLRDGASAEYGSDAIAGVVNIRLRQAREGGGASVSYGEYDTKVDALLESRTEHDGKTTSVSGWTGLPLGADGFLTLSGEYRDRDATSRGDLDNRASVTPVRITSRFGDPKSQDLTFYANAGLPLASGWELYGWAGYQDRDSESAASFRAPNNASNVLAIYPNGFLPIINPKVKDLSSAVGTRGRLAGWDTDLSLTYGRNRVDYSVKDSINASYGIDSPTSFDAGALVYDQFVLNLGFTRGVDLGLVKPVNFAWGAEARRENYQVIAGELASYDTGHGHTGAGASAQPGSQGFQGQNPIDAIDKDRSAFSVYGEAEANFTEQLLASLAVRGEHYSDFGSTATGKISLRYDFVPAFALRGTVSRGFRAPSLQQQYYTNTQLNILTVGADPVLVRTLPPSSATAQALGATDLDPEKSWNYSVGAVVRAGGFEATVDAYRIDISHRILLTENLSNTNTTPSASPVLNPLGINAARFFTNGADTTTKGIDLVLNRSLVTESIGKFDFSAAANFNHTDLSDVAAGTATYAVTGGILGRQNRLRIEQGTPKNKYVFGVDWNRAFGEYQLGTDVHVTHYGETVAPGSVAANDVVLDPTWITSLALNLKVHAVTATIGADNLFNQYPTKPTLAQLYPGGVGSGTGVFSSFSPFGFNGRFLYAKLGLNW
ncbi:MAG: TonB-dependent receptor [Pseudomonadota bacterium]